MRGLAAVLLVAVVACSPMPASDRAAQAPSVPSPPSATGAELAVGTAVGATATADPGTPAPMSATEPATEEPATEEPATEEPAWDVGATVLPLRDDGFGEVLPTPEVLRDRQLPTVDHLPPPQDGGWHATSAPVDDAVLARITEAWRPECPVQPQDLRLLTLSFWGFDDRAHTGEMIVHARVADDVTWVFEQLFAARFPLEGMRLATGADLDPPPTGDGNTTGAFICRAARGSSNWSAHASGLAVDVNPFHNPYVRGDLVLPELASAYLDRDWVRPGMIVSGDVVTEAFAAIGWTWGGTWTSLTDTMHFSATGN